jgi:hypothetical protein
MERIGEVEEMKKEELSLFFFFFSFLFFWLLDWGVGDVRAALCHDR